MISIANAQRQRLLMVLDQVINTTGMTPEELVAIRALAVLLRGGETIESKPQTAPEKKNLQRSRKS